MQANANERPQSPPLQVESAAITHPGLKRRNNEDYATFFEPDSAEELLSSGRLYIVADGVGGAAQGERASKFAAEKIKYEYYRTRRTEMSPGERLRAGIDQANKDIYTYASDNFQRMATTMVAAVIRGQQLTVANVGDSRAYLIRGGKPWRITHDHNTIGELVRNELMTAEEALHSKAKNRLTRSIGGENQVSIDLFEDIPLQPGDQILLCSDGLYRYASDEELARMVGTADPGKTIAGLVEYANQRGGADNISVILISIRQSIDPVGAPASAKARGDLPSSVNLDEMDTDPYFVHPAANDQVARASSREVSLPSSKREGGATISAFVRKFAPWLAVGILLVFVIILFIILAIDRLTISNIGSQLPLSIRTNTPLSSAAWGLSETAICQAAVGIVQANLTPQPMDQTQKRMAATQQTLLSIATLPSQPSTTEALVGGCVIEMEPGDALSAVMGRQFDVEPPYYYFSTCQDNGGTIFCENRTLNPEPYREILPGWWVETYDAAGPADCAAGFQGIWA